ncbi:hypothetical protein Vretimale_169 [Volvox reticuliferus]|uniref:ABC transmembrane type-1 domain-containing protein n=1 Tax=Volvox reticuliferus TaxID=1737510 RepID=A0A8J4D266_9CHLO|nr:hypothetical protein Vretimale_169 [Volvox reticuliferus]
MSLLDLPFSISPVVTGLMLTLLYGRTGWFAALLRETGISVVFAFTGMALATMFVTLPFVVRELIPILENMDLSQEEAARTLGANDWQVFWNVTLPNIRWGCCTALSCVTHVPWGSSERFLSYQAISSARPRH